MSRATKEWRGKTPDSKIPPRVKRKARGEPLTVQYFWDRSELDFQTGCWVWMMAKKSNGYGAMTIGGKSTRPHRAAYMCDSGIEQLPSSIDVCHRCDNRLCVNPAHLFAGSRADNMADCIAKGRFSRVPVLSGEASPNSKLTADQVIAIRADDRSGREIARAYGVDKGTIAAIRKRTTWKSI
jgi:hypothetical protein